jgi:hypothetical protein
MSLALNNFKVSATAAAGTVVGALALYNANAVAMQAEYILGEDSAGFFAVSGNNIVTMSPNLPVGNYCLEVVGVGKATYWKAKGYFVVTVS